MFVLCLWSVPAKATSVTTVYDFVPEQSRLIRVGGMVPRMESYSIQGQFQLTVDFDATAAWFDQVDATISEAVWYHEIGEPANRTQSLNVLFHMTELESTYVSATQIDFLLARDPQFPNYDIRIRVTFIDDLVYLTGGFTEAACDGYQFDIDAFVVPEPSTLFLLAVGGLVIRKRIF